MDDFEAYVLRSALDALARVPQNERADTYVVSFFVYDEEDDPRRPTLTVGTNTEAQVRFAVDPPDDFVKPNPWWEPTDPDEARWNYAFWQQNRLAVIADTDEDPPGAEARERWVRSLGLWREEPEDDSESAEFYVAGGQITDAFVALCVRVSQRLHGDGVIAEVFGRAIPVVVHELEYDDQIAEQTVAANPPGLAESFRHWVQSF